MQPPPLPPCSFILISATIFTSTWKISKRGHYAAGWDVLWSHSSAKPSPERGNKHLMLKVSLGHIDPQYNNLFTKSCSMYFRQPSWDDTFGRRTVKQFQTTIQSGDINKQEPNFYWLSAKNLCSNALVFAPTHGLTLITLSYQYQTFWLLLCIHPLVWMLTIWD